jgi:hypothetical protein
MIYYGLPEFSQLISTGGINISNPIPLKSMDHNMIHNISFLDHCNYLCQKHGTNLLRLLSVILQKLNGDMILRVNKYPQLNNKLQSEISEWGESVEPLDLFRCPDSCYNSENVVELSKLFNENEEKFKKINSDLREDDSSNLYEVLETLKNNYHSYDEDLRNNLLEIEERRNEYNSPYMEILSNLSTKPKSFYMGDLLKGDDNINNSINTRLVKGIPENIHVIFLNSILLPTLITKCMEDHKRECMGLKDMITTKHSDIEQIMSKIEPGIPLTDSIMNFITGVKGFFEENDEDLMSDDSDDADEDEPEEAKIAEILNKVVNKSDSDDRVGLVNISDLGDVDNYSDLDDREDLSNKEDDNTEKEMYHLKILSDPSDNEEIHGDDKQSVMSVDNSDTDMITFFD